MFGQRFSSRRGGARGFLWFGAGLVALLIVFAVAMVPPVAAQPFDLDRDRALSVFEQIYRFIQDNYVDEVDPDVLIEGALQGMFDSLDDPHSAYLTEDEMRGLTDTTSGEFGGVGMFINKQVVPEGDPAFIEVVSPIEDTPAYRAGLQAGDLIVAVEGESTGNLSVDEVVDRLRGRPGSVVNVTIRRGKEIEFPVELERATIRVPTVKMDMIDEIAFLRIIQFTPYTDDRVKEAIEYFEENDYESMIIDLRINPGGLLTGVVDVVDLFYDDGLIVETRGRVESENAVYRARRGKVVPEDLPIVVLIDGGSASAAEIMAAALGDRDRATLVGTTTYGKGSVQQVRRIGDAGFRLTMARYYTPSGANIDAVGVEPDVVVEEPELSEEEQQSYTRLRSGERVEGFVDRVQEPTESELNSFIQELKDDGIVLSERYIRRLVRIEVNRELNRTENYDLEYDIQLQKAVEILR